MSEFKNIMELFKEIESIPVEMLLYIVLIGSFIWIYKALKRENENDINTRINKLEKALEIYFETITVIDSGDTDDKELNVVFVKLSAICSQKIMSLLMEYKK